MAVCRWGSKSHSDWAKGIAAHSELCLENRESWMLVDGLGLAVINLRFCKELNLVRDFVQKSSTVLKRLSAVSFQP